MSGPEKDAGLKSYTVVRRMPYPHGQWCLSRTQELGQADISVLRKAELRDRLASIRKAFDKEVKERMDLRKWLVRVSFQVLAPSFLALM